MGGMVSYVFRSSSGLKKTCDIQNIFFDMSVLKSNDLMCNMFCTQLLYMHTVPSIYNIKLKLCVVGLWCRTFTAVSSMLVCSPLSTGFVVCPVERT